MKIKPCDFNEMQEAINTGKKIVVYGDKVVYDNTSGIDPHKWYREQIANATIAVEVGILEDE